MIDCENGLWHHGPRTLHDHHPYAKIPLSANDSSEHRQLALEAARESIVLLKNQNNTLPLKKDLKSIAVIGPNADAVNVLLGNYNGQPSRATTPLAGIRNQLTRSLRESVLQVARAPCHP